MNTFYDAAKSCIQEFNEFAEKYSLDTHATVDHLCYKCSDAAEFEQMRHVLEESSDFLYQSIISQRRIAIIKLQQPIMTIAGPVYYIELSDQKIDGSQKSGFDHIEVWPKDMQYEDLVKLLTEKGENFLEVKRPHHTTHDLALPNGFGIKISREPLIEKIKGDEMV